MKYATALLLFGTLAYGSSLSASASTSVTCPFFPTGSPRITLTDSSNTNPASASATCPAGYFGAVASAEAAAAYGYLTADGSADGETGPGYAGPYLASSGFTDFITLIGGSTGATARFEVTLNQDYCAEDLVQISTGALQVNGQNAISLFGSQLSACPGVQPPVSQSFDVVLTPGQLVPFGASLSLNSVGGTFGGAVGHDSLSTRITILGGLPAGESLTSQSGFDYTAVPEPGAAALISAGMLLMWIRRRRPA